PAASATVRSCDEIVCADEQSDRDSDRRIRDFELRSAGMHGGLPAAVAVAVAGGRLDGRHTRQSVLQAAAGFADRRARCEELSVHGPPWETRAHGRDLRERPAVQAAGVTTARAGA